MPAATVEAAVPAGQAELVAGPRLASVADLRRSPRRPPAPDVVVADDVLDRQRPGGVQDAVEDLPLALRPLLVLLQGVHDLVAAGQDKVRRVGQVPDVFQTGGKTFARAQFWLDVHVGHVGDAKGPDAHGTIRTFVPTDARL